MSLSTEHFLYTGIVKHRRYTPFNREFSYPIFMLYLDINDLNNVMKKSILSNPAFRYIFEVFVIIFSVTISFYIQDILNEKDREKLKNDTLKGILIDMETDLNSYNLALDVLKFRLIQADSLILGYY